MAFGEVHLVLGAGVLLAAYRRRSAAELHARCVTGAEVAGPEQVLEYAPPWVLDDVASEDAASDEDTVVDRDCAVIGLPDGRSGSVDSI